ncbi:hypothetical protein [Enterococcus faecalis]|uniref:hypothetical protein n=1 Tax=Enterococcus faecalis TaxID=1351 RepID=UPI002091CEA9|nr:hypothetical protein [Enterococcus faecalis]MCO5542039.1 hypothetical protein [Enterococcus faecalis]
MYLYAIEQYKKDNLVEITHYFFEKEDQLDYLKKILVQRYLRIEELQLIHSLILW